MIEFIEEIKSVKKTSPLFLAFAIFFSCVSILSSCDSNDINILSETEPKRINLTSQNFDDYFSYEVSGGAFTTDRTYITYSGDIVFTFYPLKNVEFENCTITVTLEHDYSNHTIAIPKNYAPKDARVPYDGKFSMTFNGVSYYYRNGRASKDDMNIKIKASGTIINNNE